MCEVLTLTFVKMELWHCTHSLELLNVSFLLYLLHFWNTLFRYGRFKATTGCGALRETLPRVKHELNEMKYVSCFLCVNQAGSLSDCDRTLHFLSGWLRIIRTNLLGDKYQGHQSTNISDRTGGYCECHVNGRQSTTLLQLWDRVSSSRSSLLSPGFKSQPGDRPSCKLRGFSSDSAGKFQDIAFNRPRPLHSTSFTIHYFHLFITLSYLQRRHIKQK